MSRYRDVYRTYRGLRQGPFAAAPQALAEYVSDVGGLGRLAFVPSATTESFVAAREVRDAVRDLINGDAIRPDAYAAALCMDLGIGPLFANDLGLASVYVSYPDRPPGGTSAPPRYALTPEVGRRDARLVHLLRRHHPWVSVPDALLLLALFGHSRATAGDSYAVIASWDPLVALALACNDAGTVGCVAKIHIPEWHELTAGTGRVRHLMIPAAPVSGMRAVLIEYAVPWMIEAYVPHAIWFRQQPGLAFDDVDRRVGPAILAPPDDPFSDLLGTELNDVTIDPYDLAPPLRSGRPTDDRRVVEIIAAHAVRAAWTRGCGDRPHERSSTKDLDDVVDAVTHTHLRLLNEFGASVATMRALWDAGSDAGTCALSESVADAVQACDRHYSRRASGTTEGNVHTILNQLDTAWRDHYNGKEDAWLRVRLQNPGA